MSQGFGDASSVARLNRDNSVDHSLGGNIKPLFKDDPLKTLTNFGHAGDQTPKSNYGGYSAFPNAIAPLFKGGIGSVEERIPETFA